ncbi:MAG: GDSL-type esterase/lipase family protein [Bacteroidaceae bacterium]|nr:GDSL-type esterase/lipase family protein [Bacteroidaceae bacterium]
MKKILLILAVAILAACGPKQPLKVACVGDSITFGHGIRDREHDAYPGVLDSLLGESYDVRNFGLSSRTLMNVGEYPYMNEQIYRDALAFNPDIVTIKLGTNDSKWYNWQYNSQFKDDLKTLIESFKALETSPRILLCLPAPAMSGRWDINDSVIVNGVIPYIREVAAEEKLEIIDLNTPLRPHKEYFPDGIHPNEAGSVVIAREIYKAITGKEYKEKGK